MRWDPEQLEKGYRYFKALEHQRRGYVVLRELIREYLQRKRWELRQPEQIELAALQLADVLIEAGAVALYQCGVNDENWRDAQERQQRRVAARHAADVSRAANDARDDEKQRVDRRLAELDAERANELYQAKLRAELDQAERDSAIAKGELASVGRAGRRT